VILAPGIVCLTFIDGAVKVKTATQRRHEIYSPAGQQGRAVQRRRDPGRPGRDYTEGEKDALNAGQSTGLVAVTLGSARETITISNGAGERSCKQPAEFTS
jgi:hypothetical protein